MNTLLQTTATLRADTAVLSIGGSSMRKDAEE